MTEGSGLWFIVRVMLYDVPGGRFSVFLKKY